MKILDQLKKLDEQRAGLLAGAKKEALEKAQAAIEELNRLGFNYALVSARGAAKKARNADPSKRHCPICDISGHDGRLHRNQHPKKKFTQKELLEMEWRKSPPAN